MLEAAKMLDPDAIMEMSMVAGADVYVRQQKEQMFDGINSEGLAIEPEYTMFTVIMKEAKGQPSTRVTLKDTGEFYQGIYAEMKSYGLEVDSKDSKSNALQEKYGDEIFGIQGEYRQPYLEKVTVETIGITKNVLRL